MLDEGSFRSWDTPPHRGDASEAYRRELAAASAATGLEESVVTGEGTVFGRRVALVACEFDFLAGSIGVAAAERITNAVERATAERRPANCTNERTCPISCICATRPPAECSRRGGRWVT